MLIMEHLRSWGYFLDSVLKVDGSPRDWKVNVVIINLRPHGWVMLQQAFRCWFYGR